MGHIPRPSTLITAERNSFKTSLRPAKRPIEIEVVTIRTTRVSKRTAMAVKTMAVLWRVHAVGFAYR